MVSLIVFTKEEIPLPFVFNVSMFTPLSTTRCPVFSIKSDTLFSLLKSNVSSVPLESVEKFSNFSNNAFLISRLISSEDLLELSDKRDSIASKKELIFIISSLFLRHFSGSSVVSYGLVLISSIPNESSIDFFLDL